MVEEFPGNARRSVPAPPEKIESKKIEKVIVGDVVRRKRPLRKKLADTFVGGDVKSVWGYIALDVLVPAAKDAIADAISQGAERFIFGEARSASRRTGLGPRSNGYVAYNRMAQKDPRERDRGPQISRQARSTFNFDEIILPTRVEAEDVVDRMFDLVSKYEMVTVSDLYEMVGIESRYTDEKYGWTDLRGAGVERITSGYLLALPRPESLK